jgi:hypothetical protein
VDLGAVQSDHVGGGSGADRPESSHRGDASGSRGNSPAVQVELRPNTLSGIMWVTFGHLRTSGHIMPDHAGDRGAAFLVFGDSRSPPYQACERVLGAGSCKLRQSSCREFLRSQYRRQRGGRLISATPLGIPTRRALPALVQGNLRVAGLTVLGRYLSGLGLSRADLTVGLATAGASCLTSLRLSGKQA